MCVVYVVKSYPHRTFRFVDCEVKESGLSFNVQAWIIGDWGGGVKSLVKGHSQHVV